MNKRKRRAHKLRFPEFQSDVGWCDRKLADVLKEHGLKSTGKEEVFSVSVHKGLVNQIEHLGRSFSASSTDHYNLVLPGDIVYTKSPTGEFPLGIIKQNKLGYPVIVSPLYGVFTPETYALGVILHAYFESPANTKMYLEPIVQKGAKNTINIKNRTFLSRTLPLPKDKNEQQKIAFCLSSLDEQISSESQKNETLKAHKKGLMQQLFPAEGETVPKMRFPEFRSDEEWECGILDDICTISSGGTPSRAKAEYWDGDIPWITTTLIHFETIMSANEFISSSGLRNSSAKILPKDTILMAMYGQGKTRGQVAILGIEAAINQACAALTLKQGCCTNFFFQYLASRYEEIRNISNDGGQKNLSATLIKRIAITYPNQKSKEQYKIADCLSSIDNLITAQSQKIETLKSHKKGLMQQLFPSADEEGA